MTVDHIVPLELGGANDLDNLQVQPLEESLEKDRLENDVHHRFCAGELTLEQAQSMFHREWP
jgi:hypothetical protein